MDEYNGLYSPINHSHCVCCALCIHTCPRMRLITWPLLLRTRIWFVCSMGVGNWRLKLLIRRSKYIAAYVILRCCASSKSVYNLVLGYSSIRSPRARSNSSYFLRDNVGTFVMSGFAIAYSCNQICSSTANNRFLTAIKYSFCVKLCDWAPSDGTTMSTSCTGVENILLCAILFIATFLLKNDGINDNTNVFAHRNTIPRKKAQRVNNMFKIFSRPLIVRLC